MEPHVNVEIRVFRHGKLDEVRKGHNVWVERGRQYLAEQVSLTSFGPDVPERDDHLRYLGVGIGGQFSDASANVPPLSTGYPGGSDPFGTSGNEYREDFPVIMSGGSYQPISTLERPVRISGGSTPYPGAGGDVWLVDTPNFFVTHPTTTELAVHARIDGTAGDVAYAPFTDVPLTEAGLFTDEAGVGINTDFSPLVAYITFGTIFINSSVVLEFIWSVKF